MYTLLIACVLTGCAKLWFTLIFDSDNNIKTFIMDVLQGSTKKYEIPIGHLDFTYIKECSNVKEVERIYRVLWSVNWFVLLVFI